MTWVIRMVVVEVGGKGVHDTRARWLWTTVVVMDLLDEKMGT